MKNNFLECAEFMRKKRNKLFKIFDKVEGFSEYSPTETLLNKNFIADAIRECADCHDFKGVIEIAKSHLDTVKKLKSMCEKD